MWKNSRGSAALVLPILGVVLLGVVGLVVARNVVKKDSGTPVPAQSEQQPSQVNMTDQLQNESCNVTVAYPEGWEESVNSSDGGCRIGLKSNKVEAPFVLLISQVQDGQSLEELQQILNNPSRIQGTNFSTQSVVILGSENTFRIDESNNKGVVSGYFSKGSKVYEVVGLYDLTKPETKSEIIQVIASIN